MKILGHIHTFNDDDVIDRTVNALMNQTHPLDEILIVDNDSKDDTLNRSFPEKVTIIRHEENLGTSGTVHTGFKYALEKGYDWIWIFDADSLPELNALEKLLELYDSLNPEVQAETWMLGFPFFNLVNQEWEYGGVFIPDGYVPVREKPGQKVYECHMNIWSGSLFKMEVVPEIGLPPAEYVLDWGEHVYGYMAKQKGFRAFIHHERIFDHNFGDSFDSKIATHGLGPLTFKLPKMPPIRLYYVYRNYVYFWLYVYFKGNLIKFLRQSSWMARHLFKVILINKFGPHLKACLSGLWDGIFKNMHHRFKVK